MDHSAKNVVTNLIWRFLERCGAQGVTFVVSIVLARLLDTEVYGVIALVTVFTTILQVFVESGMGTALIQKKDADDLDFSTVFYFNIAMCLGLYGIMFFCAPLIARFYELPELTAIVRVLSLTLVVSGVRGVQQSYVSKTMQFKRFFFATLGGTVASAIVGIGMAYLGLGVWALVAQNLVNVAVGTIILWVTVKWRPKKLFSFARLRGLFSFGWKILVSSLMETGYIELRQLIIGKIYTTNDLAFYNRGQQFPHFAVTNINSSINSVLLPAMAAEQDHLARVRAMTRRAIKISTYFMMPIMIGMAVCAEPIIRILLTEKWLPCVLYLRIYCINYAFYPIHTANLNAIKAMGRSDLFLRLETIKKSIGLVLLFATIFISVEAMAYSLLFTTLTSQIINAWPNKKLLNYSYWDQVKDMVPQIILSCVMGAAVYCVGLLRLNDFVTLLIQVPLGVAIYLAGSVICRLEAYQYLWNMISRKILKR